MQFVRKLTVWETAWWNEFWEKWALRLFIIGIGFFILSRIVTFGINLSPSLPFRFFVVNKLDLTVERGKLIAYKWQGDYYPKGMTTVKEVIGMPGDKVDRVGRHFFINDRFVGEAKLYSMDGKIALEVNPFEGVIPEGKFWVRGWNLNSLDSRYNLSGGLMDANQIIGKAYGFWQ